MTYYDKSGNLVEFDGIRTNLLGANGEIFRLPNNQAYKKYFSFAEHRIKQSIFDFIATIDSPNMVKLLERYYHSDEVSNIDEFIYYTNHSNIYDSPFNQDIQKIDLYTYQWVEKEYLDILEQPTEYLLYNINELLKLADFLSDSGVRIADMRTDNIVCNKNNIVLIDPDMYSFGIPNSSKFSLQNYNRKLLLMTLRILCTKLTEYRGAKLNENISDLFQESIRNPKEGMMPLVKKLRGYSMPIDYLAKK